MATMKDYVAPTNALIDAGVLYVGSTPVGFGATKGGLTFDPADDYRQIEFDGRRHYIAGLDRKTGGRPVIKGKMLDATAASILRYEPGATSDGSTSINTITPKALGPSFVTGDYLTNVKLWCRGQSGHVIRVVFPYALCVKRSLATTDNNEGEWDLEIEARLAPGETDLTKAAYYYEDET